HMKVRAMIYLCVQGDDNVPAIYIFNITASSLTLSVPVGSIGEICQSKHYSTYINFYIIFLAIALDVVGGQAFIGTSDFDTGNLVRFELLNRIKLEEFSLNGDLPVPVTFLVDPYSQRLFLATQVDAQCLFYPSKFPSAFINSLIFK